MEEKVAVASSVGEEIVTPEDLTRLFSGKEHPIVYDGLVLATIYSHYGYMYVYVLCILYATNNKKIIVIVHICVIIYRFEPSGRMHIAQGVLRAINVNKLTSAGWSTVIATVNLLISFSITQPNNHKSENKKLHLLCTHILQHRVCLLVLMFYMMYGMIMTCYVLYVLHCTGRLVSLSPVSLVIPSCACRLCVQVLGC